MGHKVNPTIFRIRRIEDWRSRGFSINPAVDLQEDYHIRELLNDKIGRFGVERIDIERSASKINIIISSSRPGLIIGRGGEGVEALKNLVQNKIVNKSSLTAKPDRKSKKDVRIEIREIKNPWLSAGLSAQWIAQQIEKRMPFRVILKQGIAKLSEHKEAQGVRIELAGRLNGHEIARREWLKKGRLPLQTIRANIDYAKAEAHCSYGVIGIKVWIYKGENFE